VTSGGGETGVRGWLEGCWYMHICNFLFSKYGPSHTDVYQSHKCSTALCSDPLYEVSPLMSSLNWTLKVENTDKNLFMPISKVWLALY
jgi:hypothetical protein